MSLLHLHTEFASVVFVATKNTKWWIIDRDRCVNCVDGTDIDMMLMIMTVMMKAVNFSRPESGKIVAESRQKLQNLQSIRSFNSNIL